MLGCHPHQLVQRLRRSPPFSYGSVAMSNFTWKKNESPTLDAISHQSLTVRACTSPSSFLLQASRRFLKRSSSTCEPISPRAAFMSDNDRRAFTFAERAQQRLLSMMLPMARYRARSKAVSHHPHDLLSVVHATATSTVVHVCKAWRSGKLQRRRLTKDWTQVFVCNDYWGQRREQA